MTEEFWFQSKCQLFSKQQYFYFFQMEMALNEQSKRFATLQSISVALIVTVKSLTNLTN